MKKYYGPIVLGLAALTVGATAAQTTVHAEEETPVENPNPDNTKDEGTDPSENQNETTKYTGEMKYTVDGDKDNVFTKSISVDLPSTLKPGDTTQIDAPLISGYLKNESKIDVTIGDNGTITFNQDNYPDYSDMVTGKVTFKALSDHGKYQTVMPDVTTSEDIGIKNNESKFVNLPDVDGYYSKYKSVEVTASIDENGNGKLTPAEYAIYTEKDENTVEGTVTVKLISTSESFTSKSEEFNVVGQKGSTVTLKSPDVQGYKTDSPTFSVKISNDGKTFTPLLNKDEEKKDFVLDYFDNVETITLSLPDGVSLPQYYGSNNGTSGEIYSTLPSLPNNYYWTDKNGNKITEFKISYNNGTFTYDKPVYKKISNTNGGSGSHNSNSNHSSNNKPSKETNNNKEPDTNKEPEVSHTRTVTNHSTTFYALPDSILTLFDGNGNKLTDRALGGNSSWHADQLMSLDGINYLRVATNEWAKLDDGLEVIPLNRTINTNKEARLYTGKGDLVTNRALAKNTPWFTDKSATINGQTMYRVSTNEWVSANDIQ